MYGGRSDIGEVIIYHYNGTTYVPYFRLDKNGNLGLSTIPVSTYKLSLNGSIRAKEIVVESGWADYVFKDDYNLMPIADLKDFISKHDRLPGMPTAEEVQKNGVGLADTTQKLVSKVEELTLYVIELKEQNESLKKELHDLKRQYQPSAN